MKKYNILLLLLLATSPVWLLYNKIAAAPIIEVDSQNVDIGKIREGEVAKVRHVFVIRNKGDENLIISKVKPG